MARSDGGRAAPLGWYESLQSRYMIWLFRDRLNHPAAACSRVFPSLFKEGSLIAEFRDRN